MSANARPLLTPEQEIARRSRRSFLALGVGAVAGVAGWKLLHHGTTPDGDIPPALRGVLGFNEKVARNALFSHANLAPTFPLSAVRPIKVNGDIGLEDPLDAGAWRVRVSPLSASSAPLELTMDDVRKLPRFEEIIEFKCVEGWSTVTQFAGARLADFTARFAPGSERAACVGMMTPDEEYYVSVDMPGALHPQTLLAYEMNGTPLTDRHGAPLRLVIPVKYGIKNIKRIGSIEYTNQRPADYWEERGYDWYAGL